jgi:predicted HicB family RNase H-like nuclease
MKGMIKVDNLGKTSSITTSLIIDPKLWKEVKTLAADRHLSLNKYVHEALVKYLQLSKD